jgi:[ribosomal protein S18]-alanine N-acetyltransferase
MYTVRTLTVADAFEIAAWRYDPPYQLYNMTSVDVSEEEMAQMANFLLDPATRHFAVEENDRLLAFCCFGEEARVPGYDYAQLEALDVGAGMHPARIGQGRGRQLMAAILAFGQETYQPSCWRTTVAAFNLRSQQMCRNAGFIPRDTFISATDNPREFVVMIKEGWVSGSPNQK